MIQENLIIDMAVPYRGFMTFPQGQTPAEFFVIEKTDAETANSQDSSIFQLTFWTRNKQDTTNQYAENVINHISQRTKERADISRIITQGTNNQAESRANLTSRTVLISIADFVS